MADPTAHVDTDAVPDWDELLLPQAGEAQPVMPRIGRLLRTLRLASGTSAEAAAVAAGIPTARLRRLERDEADLGYFEGRRLAKVYSLCPNCFGRLCDQASERQMARTPERADRFAAPRATGAQDGARRRPAVRAPNGDRDEPGAR